MRFDEFPVMHAIADVYAEIQTEDDTPGVRSDRWLTDPERRTQMTSRIMTKLIGSDDELLELFVKYAKSPRHGADIPKLHLTLEVARRRGEKCFYADKGNCSDDVDLDRINPGGAYTLGNCVISCSYHNRQRGNSDFSAYVNDAGPKPEVEEEPEPEPNPAMDAAMDAAALINIDTSDLANDASVGDG